MGHLTMSKKERRKKVVMENVKSGIYSLKEGARQMGVSYRQAIRIKSRYEAQGDQGLVHSRRGQPGGGLAKVVKAGVLKAYAEQYEGFGPTLANEKLSKLGYQLSRETLRQWLIEAGMWQGRQRKYKHRNRRERRERFGDLLQIDGSHHQWFSEERYTCLLNAVDDATSTSYAIMREEETTEGVLSLLKGWIERYGIPKAVYVDLKSVYVGPKHLSVFETVCKRLGIEVIKAYSAQAKGRVERSHGVYQDRLVKEIKLQGLKDIEQVNKLLSEGFVDELNERFAKAPAKAETGHVRVQAGDDLDEWICWENQRVVQNDRTISYEGRCYQIKSQGIRAGKRITVKRHLDGRITMRDQHTPISFEVLAQRPKQREIKKVLQEAKAGKPAEDHPWRAFHPGWLSKPNRNRASR